MSHCFLVIAIFHREQFLAGLWRGILVLNDTPIPGPSPNYPDKSGYVREGRRIKYYFSAVNEEVGEKGTSVLDRTPLSPALPPIMGEGRESIVSTP